jgi:exopolyphosphatase/pppGpp-phosphohydrolase
MILPSSLSSLLSKNSSSKNASGILFPSSTVTSTFTPNLLPPTAPTPSFLTALSRPLATQVTEPQKTNHLQAIIKIGSNTGSITITDLVNQYYLESDKFNLGEGLSEQNSEKKLKPENSEYSLETMERWAQILKLYGIEKCQIVATESLRAASDGQEYLDQATGILNAANPSMVISDRIIKPQEEAELSIETVKSQLGQSLRNGYVVDYGGASCEISKVIDNQLATGKQREGLFSSLKIGAHPLIAQLKELNRGKELWGKDLSGLIPQLKQYITEKLDTLRFIDGEENSKAAKKNKNKSQKDRETLYLIGGSLRKAGESIMEKGKTLNDINFNRRKILERLEARQENLLQIIRENHDQSAVKRLDHLKDLVSNLALISLLEKMPKGTEVKFIENGMVDALISREAKEQDLNLSNLGTQRPFGQITALDRDTHAKGTELAKWLTSWIQTILPEQELSEKQKNTINSAATYSYLYPPNTNTSEANRIKKLLAVTLDNKENKDQILNILIPAMTGKDSINTSNTPESNLSKLTAQVLKLAKLISFNNPEILAYFKLTKNPVNNEISLESESSSPRDRHKLASGGKVAQALGRINKIYKEITK